MTKNIRIQSRDREVLKELINFNGLPGPEIIGKFFNTKSYGYERLRALENNKYISKKYYYAQNKRNGKVFPQRISAIYYAMPKGCKEVGSTIDSRYIIPNDDKLDVSNLVGNLYSRIPNLLSKRQALEKYDLQNFIPVSCVVPGNNPAFIYVLGNSVKRLDIGGIRSFIKSGIVSGARHYIVSRNFHKRLFLNNAYFIPWQFAPEYLTNIAKDKDYYAKEFLSIAKKQFPGLQLLNNQKPLAKARYKNQIFNIGELISGSNQLRLILQEPPENTLIYAPSRQHFYGVSLKQGSFLFYSKRDKGIFKMALRDGNMFSVPYASKI